MLSYQKMAAAAILDFGKMDITLPRIETFVSDFVCWHKITHKIGSRDHKNPSNQSSRWRPPSWIWINGYNFAYGGRISLK